MRTVPPLFPLNVTPAARRTGLLASLFFVLWVVAGCEKKTEAPTAAPAATNASKPPGVVVEKTSFYEVTSQLDPGGTIYGYLGTAQWCQGLANTVDEWRNFALGLPNLGPAERASITNGFALATPLIRKSGLESLTGLGFSGIAIGNGLYRTRLVAHHDPGKGSGFIWNVMGSAPHPLNAVNMLPPDTALAGFWDFDLAALWTGLQESADQSGVVAAGEALRNFTNTFQKTTGLAWQPFLGSLGNEYGFFLTLDPEKKITIPLPAAPITLPEPGLVVVIRVKNDLLLDRIDLWLKGNPMATNMDRPGLKMRTLPLPLPLPINFRPSVARSGDYLFLASTDDLLLRVLDVQSGKKPGLKDAEEFKRLSRGIPLEGNQFSYVSRNFARALTQFQTSSLQAAGANGGTWAAMMQKMNGLMGTSESLAVARNGAEGWSMVAIGAKDPASAAIIPAVVLPTSIGAAMLLPALAKAKERAVSITCVNNLKQIGLAARIWADDHNNSYPADLLSMTNELGSPLVLVCPSAKNAGAKPGLTWQSLKRSDITYEWLGASAKTANPNDVLARCPIHGNELLSDGSVRQARRTSGAAPQ